MSELCKLQPEYRYLEPGEVIQEGDEMRMTPEIPDPWAVIKRRGAAIGCKPSDHHLRHDFQFRRRISETASQRDTETERQKAEKMAKELVDRYGYDASDMGEGWVANRDSVFVAKIADALLKFKEGK